MSVHPPPRPAEDPRVRVRRVAWIGLAALATLAVAACLDLPVSPPRPAVPASGVSASAVVDAPPPGVIRVRLKSTSVPAAITSAGTFVLSDAQGRVVGRTASAQITPGPGTLLLDGRDLGPGVITAQPLDGSPLALDGKVYRGSLRLGPLPAVPRLNVENDVALDDYLLGVLPREMPDRFGLEALKAQAVAARTYALYEVSRRGWVFADTRSQVYGGIDAESALSSRAVRETRGQVLTADGTPIKAWFHSTCGGLTAPAAEMFADAQRGVLDRAVGCPDCRASPYHSWTRRFPTDQFLHSLGLGQQPLTSLHLETDPSGRARSVEVAGTAGKARVDGESFRSRLSSGRPLKQQLLSTWITPRIESGTVVIDGRGWGHGVGMCQYGAAGFAARGATHDAILRRYYPGAEVTRLP